MPAKPLRTSDLARAVGVHPNTVRRYLDWGLLPPAERSPSGYRLFTSRHLDCLRLARMIYASEYPGRALRAAAGEIIACAVADDWPGAMDQARRYRALVAAELEQAHQAADLLEHWAQTRSDGDDQPPLSIGETAALLGVSIDVLRGWERNGLLTPQRNSYNGYRLYRRPEIERLRIIRMLSQAGYSHMAMLRMFLELDRGVTRNLKTALDTPRPDEDVFIAADHWLTTLADHEALARRILAWIERRLLEG